MTDTSVRSPKAQPAYSLRELLGYFFRLGAVEAIELDQTLLGRLLGYGTLRVGPLEVTRVAAPRSVCGLVERLAEIR